MSRPDTVAVNRLFERQYGLAAQSQLRSLGVTIEWERMRIEQHEWERYAPRVVRLCGTPDEWRRPLIATTLGSARVAVTAGSALRVHGIDGFQDFGEVYAVAHQDDHPVLGDDVHLWRSRRLRPDDVMVVDGIRTTTLATALVHAAAFHDAELVGRAVDDALRREISPGWLRQTAERWSGPGVPGSGVVSAALAERLYRRLPRSWFERLARRALVKHGIELEHEVPVLDGRRKVAVLDLAQIDLLVGLECQSWEWHSTPAARRADARRKRRLRQLGWEIIELWWSDLNDIGRVVDELREAMDRQRRLLGVSTSV